ncbi:MAG: transposase [Clostridia bacterium]|nr:transposase [Clostridia bacterium]
MTIIGRQGYYFITICTKGRKCILSKIQYNNDWNIKCKNKYCTLILTEQGEIANRSIENIKLIYRNIEIKEYIIMPNHIHILLEIKDTSDNTISNIVRNLKSDISKKVGESIWQKSFYEHLIRDEKEYIQIKDYIRNNPFNWNKDKYYY